MKSCNISHKIIESVSGHLSCTVKVDSVQFFHYIGMIRYLKIRNKRLTELFDFYILTVILTYRYARIDNVRNGHHILFDLLFKLCFNRLKFCKLLSKACYRCLYLLGLFFLALRHKCTDFF